MATSASQASEPAIQIDEAILDEVFVSLEEYQVSEEELWTHSQAAEILGATVAAIRSQKNKHPDRYVWGEFWKYIEKPASELIKSVETQTMVGWTKAGLLQLSFYLTETPQMKLFKDYMRESALNNPEFTDVTLFEFIKKQQIVSKQQEEKQKPFIEALAEARCLHISCQAVLTSKQSIAWGMGYTCYKNKCGCANKNLRKRKAKKGKKR